MRQQKKFEPRTPHAPTCWVESNGRRIEAVVNRFRPKESLEVIINRSVKLPMQWNGLVYEGHSAGLEFTSDGPALGKY